MATTLKVLGQQAPTGTTEASIYTVPSATSTVISTISIANITTSSATFRIRVAVANAAAANKQYLFYDASLAGNTSTTLTLGLTLATTDQIYVQTGTANALAFQAFGSEIS